LNISDDVNATHPKIKSISPQLVVADLERSLDFYTGELGFKIEFLYEDFYASIISDGYTIHLKSGSPTVEERENRRKNEDLDLVFSVGNIDGLFEVIKNSSVIIVQPPREMPYGHEFYIADPDGYILGFIEEK